MMSQVITREITGWVK